MLPAPGPSSDSASPPGSAVAAGIVFALGIEADAFERLAVGRITTRTAGGQIHQGLVAGRRIAWSVGGTGGSAAARAARLLVAGHRPGILVTAGFAGGLVAKIERGAVVRPHRVVTASGGGPLALAGPSAESISHGPTICSVDRVIATPEEKRALAAASGADLVDMETYAVATVAHDAGLQCVAIRVVSDAADDVLPHEVTLLARPQSPLRRLGTAVGMLGRRPGAAVDLWRTWERAVVDGRTLAAAVAGWCSDLPSSQGR